ncbi:MAG: Ig domain-containing protein [Acidimicrobiia bacterium]
MTAVLGAAALGAGPRGAIPASAVPGPSISDGGVFAYVEQAPALAIGTGLTVTGGGSSFGAGYLDVAVGAGQAGETLSFSDDGAGLVANSVVSVHGSSVYVGDGDSAEPIGFIDPTRNGAAGAPLRVHFRVPLDNPGFEAGDLTGWTALDQRIDLGADQVAGCLTADTSTYPTAYDLGVPLPARQPGDDLGTLYGDGFSPVNDDYIPTVAGTKSTTVVSDAPVEGSHSVRLTSSGVTTRSGFDVTHGPAVVSDAFSARFGDKVNFDWRAVAGAGGHAVLAYLVDTTTCTQTELLDSTASTLASTMWASVESVVPASSDNYRIVLVAGTFDIVGGRSAGAALYLDDLRVFTTVATDDVVQQLARKLRYRNTSVAAPTARTVTVAVETGDGASASDTITVNVAPQPAAPVLTDSTLGAPHVGAPYADGVAATGYPAPTYSLSAGTMPPGLGLDTVTGAITGTPTIAAPYAFTISASNPSGSTSVAFSGGVVGPPTAFTDGAIGSMTWGMSASDAIATDGYPKPSFGVAAGALPPGLSLSSSTGALTGTPTAPGRFDFTIAASNGIGTVSKSFSILVASTDRGFAGLSPIRVLDTRTSGEKHAGGSVREVVIAGVGGLPSDATAVAMNVAVTEPDDAGFITVFPCGATVPWVANLNYVAGQTVSNAVMASIGDGGRVCLYASSTTHVVVDVDGAYSATTGHGQLQARSPARLSDSRDDAVKPEAGSVRRVQVAGRMGVPSDATSVVVNVAVTEPEDAGYVTLFACGEQLPLAANLNYVAGQTISNAATSALGDGGAVCLFTSAAAHLVVDVTGAYVPSGGSGHVPGIAPDRLVDTRTIGGAVEAGTVHEVLVAGRSGVPADAAAVAINLAIVEPSTDGYATVHPCGSDVPLAASVNFTAGQTVSNAVIAATGGSGTVCVYTTATTHLVIDVNGAYSSPIV